MTVATAKSDWISRQRVNTNALIAACQAIISADEEYVANGYGASLINGDFTGSNTGILASDMTTAEGNLVKVAQAVLGLGTFPVSIVSGTNTTIFAIR